MKLIFYTCKGAHRNNIESIERMCKSCNIYYQHTTDINILKTSIYDLLICNDTYIAPEDIPENVKIIYGPQFFVLPEGVFCSKYEQKLKDKCVYNCLSNWVKNLYLEVVNGYENFMINLEPLPFGVNMEKFQPNLLIDKSIDCLVYFKHRKSEILDKVISILQNLNMTYEIIIYGNYNEKFYIEILHKCKFMISIDAHESQGFALQEAMSTNIPMIIINASSMFDEILYNNVVYEKYKGIYKMCATSVPYWSEKCGIVTTIENFSEKDIFEIINNLKKYSQGREFIEKTLSDKVCMERILNYFNYHLKA